jgi:hypothetical protein
MNQTDQIRPDRPEQPVEARAIDDGSVEERRYFTKIRWQGAERIIEYLGRVLA